MLLYAVAYMKTLCKTAQFKQAMHLLDRKDVMASTDTYVSLLQECISTRSLTDGQHIHAHIVKQGLKINIFLGSTLANMYLKCGSVVDAWQVFEEMPERNLFTWTIMIAGLTEQGLGKKALNLFHQMELQGLNPDKVTFISILKACASVGALEQGKQIHASIVKRGLESDVFVGSTLIDMYSKCGNIERARQVFDAMTEQNVVSWTAMIAGYAQHGQGEEALELFQLMEKEGLRPNKVTFLSILKACASVAALEPGKRIHAQMIENSIDLDIFLGNALIDMYAKCGGISCAHQVFDAMPKRNVVTWTAMMSGFIQHGQGKESLELFWQMERQGIKPDRVAFITILKACASVPALEHGRHIHRLILQNGFELDVFLGNSLICMYAKCGSIEDARELFDRMQIRDVVSWNSMIAGYAQYGHGKEAFELFWKMEYEGLKPDKVTFASILKVCAIVESLELGRKLHSLVINCGFASDVFVGSTLIDMYAKCGNIKLARQVFDEMPKRNVITWTAIISGYAQHGEGDKALKLFWRMEQEGVHPNRATYVSILKACASVAALEQGKQIHLHIIQNGWDSDVSVGNSLIHMYAECGNIEEACQVFHKMLERNRVSWNALVAGYSQHGCSREALLCAEQMKMERINLDHITFACLLSACSHAGLVDEGQVYFDSMAQDYGIIPTDEHYACMVDLFCRSGLLKEAGTLIQAMPSQPSSTVWTTLLGACKIHGNMELAKHATESIMQSEPTNPTACVLLSNVYAAAGRWKEKAKVRQVIEANGFNQSG